MIITIIEFYCGIKIRGCGYELIVIEIKEMFINFAQQKCVNISSIFCTKNLVA